MSAPNGFVKYINTNLFSLQFSVQSNNPSIDFLDVIPSSDPSTEMVSTTTFRKVCSSTTLYATSYHPSHTTNAIPYGELICTRRNCSTESALDIECQNISTYLSENDYSISIIQQGLSRVRMRNREDLLADTFRYKNQSSDNTPVMFVITYSKVGVSNHRS